MFKKNYDTKVRQKMHIRKKRAFENDKFIYQLWHHRGQCELAHNWTLGWCSKEGESLIFKCERERIGCILRT